MKFGKRPASSPAHKKVLTAAEYFSRDAAETVVRRGELLQMFELFGVQIAKVIERRKWYRRLWRWLMTPFTALPKAPVTLDAEESAVARKVFDANGQAVEPS